MRIWLLALMLAGCGGSKPAAVPACSGVDYIGSWLADSGNTLVFQDDCTYEIALAGGDSCPDKGISKKAVVPGALYMDDYTKTETPCSYDTATTSIALACTYELAGFRLHEEVAVHKRARNHPGLLRGNRRGQVRIGKKRRNRSVEGFTQFHQTFQVWTMVSPFQDLIEVSHPKS